MKQLFSVFPAGATGLGLLLLRMACATQLVAATFSGSLPTWLKVTSAAIAAALALGVLTQAITVAGMFLLAFEVVCLAEIPGTTAAIHGLDMLALSLLGAGAYSIDARLFGRRVINF